MSATSVVSGAFLWRFFIEEKLLKDLSYFDNVVQERKYSKSVVNQVEAKKEEKRKWVLQHKLDLKIIYMSVHYVYVVHLYH